MSAFSAIAAFFLGAFQLAAPKGTLPHRTFGFLWVGLMLVVSISSFWIHELRWWGEWSPIHLLSIYVLVMVPLALWHAHRHDVLRHRKAMIGIFPEVADVPLAYSWSGLVAMTLDSVPHVGRVDDRVMVAMGYNGAGVAMSSLMGRYLAAFARGERPDVGLLDASRMRPVPFYALREPAVRAVAGWYQFLDAIGR